LLARLKASEQQHHRQSHEADHCSDPKVIGSGRGLGHLQAAGVLAKPEGIGGGRLVASRGYAEAGKHGAEH